MQKMVKNKKKIKEKRGYFSRIGGAWGSVKGFFCNPKVQFVAGMLLVAFAVFLISSFVSFFSFGGADQTAVEATLAGGDAPAENSSGCQATTMTKQTECSVRHTAGRL